MKDFPLIIFTLTMQAAIGAILWAAFVRFKNKEAGPFKRNTLIALILSALGIVASLVHLGKPFLAITSMFNIASSWLSREIFFSGGFFVLLLIYWWLERSTKAQNIQNGLNLLVCLAGLASVFSMAQLYMNTIMPSWQSVNTLIDFLATTLILGAVVFYLTAEASARESLPRLDLVILGIVFVQVAFVPGYIASLGAAGSAGQDSAALLAGSFSLTVILRWLLMLGGVFLFIISRTGKLVNQANFLYLAVTVLIIGEFVGRFVFYASGIPIGIGI